MFKTDMQQQQFKPSNTHHQSKTSNSQMIQPLLRHSFNLSTFTPFKEYQKLQKKSYIIREFSYKMLQHDYSIPSLFKKVPRKEEVIPLQYSLKCLAKNAKYLKSVRLNLMEDSILQSRIHTLINQILPHSKSMSQLFLYLDQQVNEDQLIDRSNRLIKSLPKLKKFGFDDTSSNKILNQIKKLPKKSLRFAQNLKWLDLGLAQIDLNDQELQNFRRQLIQPRLKNLENIELGLQENIFTQEQLLQLFEDILNENKVLKKFLFSLVGTTFEEEYLIKSFQKLSKPTQLKHLNIIIKNAALTDPSLFQIISSLQSLNQLETLELDIQQNAVVTNKFLEKLNIDLRNHLPKLKNFILRIDNQMINSQGQKELESFLEYKMSNLESLYLFIPIRTGFSVDLKQISQILETKGQYLREFYINVTQIASGISGGVEFAKSIQSLKRLERVKLGFPNVKYLNLHIVDILKSIATLENIKSVSFIIWFNDEFYENGFYEELAKTIRTTNSLQSVELFHFIQESYNQDAVQRYRTALEKFLNSLQRINHFKELIIGHVNNLMLFREKVDQLDYNLYYTTEVE